MLIWLLWIPMLDLKASIHQVQDPKHIVDQQTQVVVHLNTLVYWEVKPTLYMH
jgi:hypothetical protein